MSKAQSDAARGRKRKRRSTDTQQPRDFKGYGKLKCEMCGLPLTRHKTYDFCLGKEDNE